jgi:hypothetical protein
MGKGSSPKGGQGSHDPPPAAVERRPLPGEKGSGRPIPYAIYASAAEEARPQTGKDNWLAFSAARVEPPWVDGTGELSAPDARFRNWEQPPVSGHQRSVRMAREEALSVVPTLNAHRFVHFVQGRPVLIIKLSHRAAAPEERVPYLASIFAPAPVLEIEGRAADLPPACPRRQAVWWGWHDSILPLALSPQTPPDTLVLVIESDFRLCEEHSKACKEYDEDGGEMVSWHGPPKRTRTGWAAEPPKGGRPKGDRGKGTGELSAPVALNWWERRYPEAPAPTSKNSPHLENIVGVVTHATREDHGLLVWLSWETKNDRNTPQNGSTVVALTKTAAAGLLLLMGRAKKPTHFDCWLTQGLCGQDDDPDWILLRNHSCYVWNPIGGYQTHKSGCESELMREEAWKRWQPWADVRPSQKPRWLVRFGDKDTHPRSRKVADLPAAPRLTQWKTYIPASMRGETGQRFNEAKLARAVGAQSWRRRHPVAPTAKSKPAASSQPRTAESAETDRSQSAACGPAAPGEDTNVLPLEDDAASVLSYDSHGQTSPADSCSPTEDMQENISEQAEQPQPGRKLHIPSPVDMPNLEEVMLATESRERRRRKAVQAYHKFRIFTKNEARACLWKCRTHNDGRE